MCEQAEGSRGFFERDCIHPTAKRTPCHLQRNAVFEKYLVAIDGDVRNCVLCIVHKVCIALTRNTCNDSSPSQPHGADAANGNDTSRHQLPGV